MENFVHAIFEEEIPTAQVGKLKRWIKEEIKKRGYKIEEDAGIISAGDYIKLESKYITFSHGREIVEVRPYKDFVPVLQVGVESDNIIATAVGHQSETYPSCNLTSDYELLNGIKEEIERLSPSLVLKGNHNCSINCWECCDSPAHDNFVVTRYCKYASEIGWYCLPLLTNSSSFREKICEEYWCFV